MNGIERHSALGVHVRQEHVGLELGRGRGDERFERASRVLRPAAGEVQSRGQQAQTRIRWRACESRVDTRPGCVGSSAGDVHCRQSLERVDRRRLAPERALEGVRRFA